MSAAAPRAPARRASGGDVARAIALLFALLATLGLAGCKRVRGALGSKPAEVARGVVVSLEVPGDVPVAFVRATSASKRVIVYLPPRCVDAGESFREWAVVASRDASALGLTGDTPCPASPHQQLTTDITKLSSRVDAALSAAAAVSQIDRASIVLAGYSQGAARAEDLVQHDPARFPRALLIGAPEAPQVSHLGRARAVATAAGERDRRDLMLTGTQALGRAGVPSRFFLLPGAAHGEFGPEGGDVMLEAIAWLFEAAP
ncbi:MAG: hypothetical protein IT374_01790 [Polyangiaceae bacterium]|nr:hypothetical protein [Polyangiaceae bacterium]